MNAIYTFPRTETGRAQRQLLVEALTLERIPCRPFEEVVGGFLLLKLEVGPRPEEGRIAQYQKQRKESKYVK
jgi:hypothetical protein